MYGKMLLQGYWKREFIGSYMVVKSSRIIMIFTSIFLFNCATIRYDLTPILINKNMEKFYKNDKEILFCTGQKSNLLIFSYRDKNEIYIYPCILNKTSDSYIDIVPEKIEIFGVNDSNKILRLHIYSAKEYIEKKKREHKWSEFSVALGGAMNAMNAARSSTYTTGYSNFSGTFGGYTYSGNTFSNQSTTTYDYSKSLEAQARSKQELNELRNNHNLEIQNLDNTLLKKNTLPPNYFIEGYVVAIADRYYDSKYIIIFPVGNEKFKLLFKPSINN
jgi:hypothetical protein